MKGTDKQLIVFILLVAMLYSVLLPGSYIFSRPHGDHAWAQCDRASWALNYYQFGYNFTEPRTHNIVYNPSGIATGEFPAIPYLVSKLYAIFGFHEFIFRLITLVFTLPAFVVAFLLARKLLSNTLSVLTASLLWLCSPNLIYYSTTFLPDTVALAFFAAGFWFIADSAVPNFKRIVLFSFFASVAVLLKSSLLFLVAAVYISLLINGWVNNKLKVVFTNTMVLTIPLLVCVGWLMYGRNSQLTNHSAVFKLGVLLPRNLNEISNALYLFARNLPKLYPLPIWIVFGVMAYLLVIRFSRNNFLHIFTVVGFGMWAIFFVILMRNAGNHGYYHIPFQFLLFTLTATALKTLPNHLHTTTKTITIGGLAAIASLLLFIQTTKKISTHYSHINTEWLSLEPELRKAGISYSNKVFTAYDESYNISLYLMNQRGWNSMPGVWDYYKQDGLKACDYAVLTSDAINDSVIIKHLGVKLWENNSVSVFRINH